MLKGDAQARSRARSRSRSRTPPPGEQTGQPRKHPTDDATKNDPKRSKPSPQDENAGGSGSPSPPAPTSFKSAEEAINYFVERTSLPANPPVLDPLSQKEVEELEKAFDFEGRGEGWRDDWSGNLAYADEDILNPKSVGGKGQTFRQPLVDWAPIGRDQCRLLHNLIRYV